MRITVRDSIPNIDLSRMSPARIRRSSHNLHANRRQVLPEPENPRVDELLPLPKSRLARISPRKTKAKKGRSATRNAELSRQEILAAAMREFSAKGLRGARIDEIAARYGGSKNMIYHYFKSKDGLFTAVLESMYATIRDHQRDFEIKLSDPMTGIRDLVRFTVDVFDQNPEFVTLLHSENIAKAQHIAGSKSIPAMYERLLSMIDGLLSRGLADGIFTVRVSAIDLYICICAMSTYAISNRYTLSAISGTDVYAPAHRKLRRQLIADMVLAYLTRK